jgi:decaprenylphospho-beta-D-erythro-pentofuranosid-2-ulose 2-reductase
MANKRVAIFGATSDIAIAFARRVAENGARLVLVARNPSALKILEADLMVRGATEVTSITADMLDIDQLPHFADKAWAFYSGLDIALVAYGSLPEQASLQGAASAVHESLLLNFVSPAILSEVLADRFEKASTGTLAVITSVAGDRGRKSNYLYGSAKGGLQRLLQGMRHRFSSTNVRVLDIRPGFVITKMTNHIAGRGAMWAPPSVVARDIEHAIVRGADVLYTPWFWKFVMLIVRSLPTFVFHRTSL